MGRFLKRGESKDISLFLNGKSYNAKINNVKFDQKFKRKKDTLQIRYSKNGELAVALRACFNKSYSFIKQVRENREPNDRTMIRLPEELKEYLVIYTTEYDDTYVLEPIFAEELEILRTVVHGQEERLVEAEFDYDLQDSNSELLLKDRVVKIRKLNRKIGDNLKLLYDYRCQICGDVIGEEYGTHVVEAHHIDYFVSSLNNDADNQLIVCPNHHSIIHDTNPVFEKRRLLYIYSNGKVEKLSLNLHL